MQKTYLKKLLIAVFIVFIINVLLSFNIVKAYSTNNNSNNSNDRYTVEDIIFNRIPILDINFFSDTAAGQTISKDSVVYILRNIVATWYVSFRNLAVVSLAVIIIYVGIRMALSTSAQGKAKYKQMLIGWIQALVIVVFIHMIMILIINTNNSIVDIIWKALEGKMAADGWSEISIYDTIESRAYDFRASVGIPALIMYVALAIIFFRFLWVYIKRSFTILILVIVAPFIGAKYAIDSASGKKGNSFRSWLYDFTFNVLIQTVHALVYTTIMTVAISMAFESITGYIIALIFMNFMLSADEIFRNIFNFDKSSLSSEAAKQEGYKEILNKFSGVLFAAQMTKLTVKGVKAVGKFGEKNVRRGYRFVTNRIPGVGDFVNTRLNSIDELIEKATEKSATDANKSDNNGIKNNIASAIHYQAKIRRLSRKKGEIGVKARNIKNSISQHIKKRYTANFKLVKDITTGSASLIFAIPMSIVNFTAGTALFAKGINSLNKVPHKKTYKYNKKTGRLEKQSEIRNRAEKYTQKRDKLYQTVDLAEKIGEEEEDIRSKIDELKKTGTFTDEDFEGFKEKAGTLLVEASSTAVDKIIEEYVAKEQIRSLDNSSINAIIDEVSQQLQINIKGDNLTRELISSKAKSKVIFMNMQRRRESGEDTPITKDDITSAIIDSSIESVQDSRFVEVTKKLFELDRDIKKFESKAKTKYRGANKFLENL